MGIVTDARLETISGSTDTTDVNSPGIANVVEDTSPQLGGTLDMNSNIIDTLRVSTNFSLSDVDIGFGSTNNMGFTANSGGTAVLFSAGGVNAFGFNSTDPYVTLNEDMRVSTGHSIRFLGASLTNTHLQFDGDPNTGITFGVGGGDTVSMVAGGIETIRVQNNGILIDSTSSLFSFTMTTETTMLIQAGSSSSGTGGANELRGGSSTSGTAGDAILRGGGSTNTATGGNAIVASGLSNSGTDGNILFRIGNAQQLEINNSGSWQLGAGEDAGTAGQVLRSNGSGAAPTWANGIALADADTDTLIQVEESADEDIIRFDVGDSPAGYGGVDNIMTLASSGLTVAMGTANTAATAGAPISITAGTGNTTGNGGAIGLTAGDGGTTGAGGAVNITSGTSAASQSGDIKLQTGSALSNGGDIDMVLGGGTACGKVNVRSNLSGTGLNFKAEVRLFENADNGTNYVGLAAENSITTNKRLIVPSGASADGNMLAIDLGEFTVAGLPSASTYANCWALATDAVGGRTIVRSDGTNWKIVAVEGATVT